jgi:hypothetical protein
MIIIASPKTAYLLQKEVQYRYDRSISPAPALSITPMPRKHTQSFVLELPLGTTAANERAYAIAPRRRSQHRQRMLGEGLRRLDRMGRYKRYRSARKMWAETVG